MSSTNKTTNYQLPQFVSSDKPTWLGDVNGAMAIIDGQMKTNADAASAASAAASAAATQTALNAVDARVTSLESSVNQISADLQKIRVYNGTFTTPTCAGNTSNTATVTLPNNYKAILAVIPFGYVPSNDWNTRLIYNDVVNNDIAFRVVGSTNQYYYLHYIVIYTVD